MSFGFPSFLHRITTRILENYLFGLNRSAIKVGKTLQNKVGWNENVKQLFADLGFEYAPYVPHAPTPISTTFPPNAQDLASSDQRPKQPPSLGTGLGQAGPSSVPQSNPSQPQQSPPYLGKLAPPFLPDVSVVQKMLRAWVELTVRCAAWKQRYRTSFHCGRPCTVPFLAYQLSTLVYLAKQNNLWATIHRTISCGCQSKTQEKMC